MPLYEYRCEKCEEKFETLVSLRDSDAPVKCPHCGSDKTNKLLSTFAAWMGASRSNLPGCSTCDTAAGKT